MYLVTLNRKYRDYSPIFEWLTANVLDENWETVGYELGTPDGTQLGVSLVGKTALGWRANGLTTDPFDYIQNTDCFAYFRFVNDSDAVLFKLIWGGE